MKPVIQYPIILTTPNVMIEIVEDRAIITRQDLPTNIIVITKEDGIALGSQLLGVAIGIFMNI